MTGKVILSHLSPMTEGVMKEGEGFLATFLSLALRPQL